MSRLTASMLVATACTTPATHNFTFSATIDPQQTQVLVNGAAGVNSIQGTFASFQEAKTHLVVPVDVSLNGTTVSSVVQPGYCFDAATMHNADLGELWLEDVQLAPTSGLLLTAESLHCESSTGTFDQVP